MAYEHLRDFTEIDSREGLQAVIRYSAKQPLISIFSETDQKRVIQLKNNPSIMAMGRELFSRETQFFAWLTTQTLLLGGKRPMDQEEAEIIAMIGRKLHGIFA